MTASTQEAGEDRARRWIVPWAAGRTRRRRGVGRERGVGRGRRPLGRAAEEVEVGTHVVGFEVQLVDATGDSSGSTGVVLVAEGVAEHLDRVGAGDPVPVAVQPRVDVDERQGPVALQHDEAGVAELPAAHGFGTGRGRREQGEADRGGTAASLLRHLGPERLARLDQAVAHIDPLLGDRDRLGVELAQSGEQVVALHLDDEALAGSQARGHPVPEHARVAERLRPPGREAVGDAPVDRFVRRAVVVAVVSPTAPSWAAVTIRTARTLRPARLGRVGGVAGVVGRRGGTVGCRVGTARARLGRSVVGWGDGQGRLLGRSGSAVTPAAGGAAG